LESTTWNDVVVRSGALVPDRVSFGFLHAAVILPNGTMALSEIVRVVTSPRLPPMQT